MKKAFIIVPFMIILAVIIHCIRIRTYTSDNRSERSKYLHGYVYDRAEKKTVQGIRIYPMYCIPEFGAEDDVCTTEGRVGVTTDENGYFKLKRPEFDNHLLVVGLEGTNIGGVSIFNFSKRGLRSPFFLDRKRADTIFIDMRYEPAVRGGPDHRRLAKGVPPWLDKILGAFL
jgi:hypothetical protein